MGVAHYDHPHSSRMPKKKNSYKRLFDGLYSLLQIATKVATKVATNLSSIYWVDQMVTILYNEYITKERFLKMKKRNRVTLTITEKKQKEFEEMAKKIGFTKSNFLAYLIEKEKERAEAQA